jgi:hypothetical protein
MIRIGIIGENENDTKAISALLKKNFPEQFYFTQLLPGRNGSQLDDHKISKLLNALRREFEFEEIHYILYIRDLDTLISDKKQLTFRKNRFRRFAKVVNNQAIFMLNIVEIEALILADFDTFKKYKNEPNWQFDNSSAAEIENPSDYLERNTSYQKNELVKIIPLLHLDTLKANHQHFKAFLTEFFKMIDQRKYKNTPYYT